MESKCDVQKRFSSELFDCLQVLDGTGLEYWLDCGTLLGAHRDNSFIKWDNDIDLGILPDQVDRIVGLKQELKNAGFEVTVVSYRGKVQLVQCCRHKPPVNFNVYHDGGEKYWSLWMVADNSFSRMNMRLIHQKSNLSRVYRSVVKVARSLIPKHVVSRLFRDKMLVIEVPRAFFERPEEISFMGHRFYVPANREAYLEYRYGKDWRTPCQDWVYSRDDGAASGHRPGSR